MPIQLFTSMRIQIRIHAAKPMRIDADPDPSQTLLSQNVGFLLEKILYAGTYVSTNVILKGWKSG
jgi:hypothetical protein